MGPSTKEGYPVCLVACKIPYQEQAPEKGVQSSSSHSGRSLKESGSLQDFSSYVGASGVIIDYEKGLVITTALPFADAIPSKQATPNYNHSSVKSGRDDGTFYSGPELKELSVTLILQNSRANGRGKVNQSFQSTRLSSTNRQHPSVNKVFSALSRPSRSLSSQIESVATEPFLVHEAKVLLLWKCCPLDNEIKKLLPSTDGWELDYGERQGEIGSSSHLGCKKDAIGGGNEKEKTDNSQNFLSWFALLQVAGGLRGSTQHPIKIIPSCSLHLAQPVTACGTPFATLSPSIFYNSVSEGIITKRCDGDLVMTDARCLPGMEGGALFVTDKKERYLAAMIISPLCWKASEWIGLTLACSLSAILDSLLDLTSFNFSIMGFSNFGGDSHVRSHNHLKNTGMDPKHFQSVVLLRVGTVWGSGVIVDEKEGLILTCRHVVKNAQFNKVSVKLTSGSWIQASVVYTNPMTSALDLAVLKVEGHRDSASLISVQMASGSREGSRVYAVGFPLFDPIQSSTPSVTSGVMSKVIRVDQKPFMIQSSCAVHAGASGGALLCAETGDLVGIIASNSRDRESGASFPHVNFSIPVECFRDAVQRYMITNDQSWLKDLEVTDERVTAVWALEEIGKFRRLPSKL